MAEEPIENKTKNVEPDFTLFLSTLGLQGYVALGELADPATKTKTTNLSQAKYMIDLIGIIEDKTKGNLTPDEEGMVGGLLSELRLKYVEKVKNEAKKAS